MASSRGSGSSGDEIREPIEALRQELASLGDRIDRMPKREAATPLNHMRRFGPFYALAIVWALMLAFFPTSRDKGPQQGVATGSLTTTQQQQSVAPASVGSDPGQVVTGYQDPSAAGSAVVGTGAGAATATQKTAAGAVSAPGASNLTRGGFECKAGVRQIPWSAYIAPCVVKWTGTNPGATARGVTKDQVLILTRKFPDSANSQAVDQFAQAAGAASKDVEKEVQAIFIDYFNKVFELWGRKLVFQEFEASSQSNSTDEAQGRGKEGACIDATKAAQELKTFAVTGSSAPFSECLAERQVTSFGAGAYYPESWLKKYHPYLFNGVTECERIAYQNAEYVGKRLAHKKAKWAGDALTQAQERKFAMYVPTNDGYQQCADQYERELKTKYGVTLASRYNYTLDVSRFPDEAARGIVQFKAAGVTTIGQSCDPISTTLMTSAATSQNYFPEWQLWGVALQDVDSVARLYDSQQADQVFGMSQLGDTSKLVGPTSEMGKSYKAATGKEVPTNATGGYWGLIGIFSAIQAAGPNLTAVTLEKAIHALPPGGAPDFAVGYTSYQDGPDGKVGAQDHTGIDDSREIYWCAKCVSKQDGKDGAYLETYGGKRFRNGEWPAEEPPVWPNGR